MTVLVRVCSEVKFFVWGPIPTLPLHYLRTRSFFFFWLPSICNPVSLVVNVCKRNEEEGGDICPSTGSYSELYGMQLT